MSFWLYILIATFTTFLFLWLILKLDKDNINYWKKEKLFLYGISISAGILWIVTIPGVIIFLGVYFYSEFLFKIYSCKKDNKK